MKKTWTKEQLRDFLSSYEVKDGKSLELAFMDYFKGLVQALMEEEMNDHLGYEKYELTDKKTDNSRNGHSKKKVRSSLGDMELEIPRDKDGEYEPVLVKKHERLLSPLIEDKIISLYAKGMSTRDIDRHLMEIYGINASPEMISAATEKILQMAKDWQARPLEEIYAIVYLDALFVSVKSEGVIQKKAVYMVHGISLEGEKDILGIWIGDSESAKFWLGVLNDLKARGVMDILISAVDGLKGFSQAINAVFPMTDIQRCIVHQVRQCTRFVNYRDLKAFCDDMKKIYTAAKEEDALKELDALDAKWGKLYGYAIKSWRENWGELSTIFKYPPELRKIIYTTNPIEGVNRRIRKYIKTKGSFPSEDALFKMLFLIIRDVIGSWKCKVYNWSVVIGQLRIIYAERIEKYMNS